MAWERKLGKRWLTVGFHKNGVALGFGISKYSIDIDLVFVYIGLEL
jgi:hypothetical protein